MYRIGFGKLAIETMLEENMRLCLEAADDSASKQYRIDNGKVEVRTLHSDNGYDPPESGWHRLTPQQLSTHVERNTVVAQWLERRLGWRRLLQACVSQEAHDWTTAEDFVDKHAA
jgi:hypothetical protein